MSGVQIIPIFVLFGLLSYSLIAKWYVMLPHPTTLTSTTAATAAPQLSIYWVVICGAAISSGSSSGNTGS